MINKKLKKISVNQIICLITSFIIMIIAITLPVKIFVNLTDSLPDKYFLVITGKLPLKNDYAAFKNDKSSKFYSQPFIKKIIGIGGDEIKQLNNNYWIASDHYPFITPAGVAKEYSLTGEKLDKTATGKIPNNYYYAYAPHKDSLDSRYQQIGLISKSDIIGKAMPITIKNLGFFFGLTVSIIFLVIRLAATRFFLVALIILLPFNSHAKDLGVHGKLYNIAETDLAQDIQNKLSNLEQSGELKKLQEKWQKRTIAASERPKGTELPVAIKTIEKIYDPSVTAQNDIYDHIGNIIVKKGTSVNPLHYQNLPENLLFINGDNKQQVKWALSKAKQYPAIIILVKGNIMQLMRDNKTRLYFDQNGYLIKTFNIQSLPAEIYQDQDVLKVREAAL